MVLLLLLLLLLRYVYGRTVLLRRRLRVLLIIRMSGRVPLVLHLSRRSWCLVMLLRLLQHPLLLHLLHLLRVHHLHSLLLRLRLLTRAGAHARRANLASLPKVWRVVEALLWSRAVSTHAAAHATYTGWSAALLLLLLPLLL